VIEIDLPRPRSAETRNLARFVELVRAIRATLRELGAQ
jgi:hypothetical protein